jgi:hypothetical protein
VSFASAFGNTLCFHSSWHPSRLTVRSSRRRISAALKVCSAGAILAPHCRGRRGLTQALGSQEKFFGDSTHRIPCRSRRSDPLDHLHSLGMVHSQLHWCISCGHWHYGRPYGNSCPQSRWATSIHWRHCICHHSFYLLLLAQEPKRKSS